MFFSSRAADVSLAHTSSKCEDKRNEAVGGRSSRDPRFLFRPAGGSESSRVQSFGDPLSSELSHKRAQPEEGALHMLREEDGGAVV